MEVVRSFLQSPYQGARYVAKLTEVASAAQFSKGDSVRAAVATQAPRTNSTTNPLKEFVEGRTKGRGIWKWNHYFEAYDRHLKKFVGRDVHLIEIGIFSGGSLEMWRHYLGNRAHLTGVDIQPACKSYENDHTSIVIGDQGDREFWASFKRSSPPIDIVIDDGGHHLEQQRVTLEEMLPVMRPGGVFICEDVHGLGNPFGAYAHGLADQLNAYEQLPESETGLRYASAASEFQKLIGSVHFYPYMVVIERSDHPVESFLAVKRGTEWQPFL